jgi:cardiolipin synthase (CMP-forming)
MTLATAVTLLRLGLVPLFGVLLFRGDARALPLFGAIAAGDLLDGLLARTVSRRTRLGGVLDAAADKALMTVAFVLGATARLLPVWLAAVVVCRDALQAGVWLVLGARRGESHQGIRWEPSRVGKYATFAQALSMLGALASPSAEVAALLRSWMVLTAVLTLVSGTQYLVRAARQAGGGAGARGAA